MNWIEELRDKEGNIVVLNNVGTGHGHWGFILGDVYRIVYMDGVLKFHGRFKNRFEEQGWEIDARKPASNYAGWLFKRVKPLVLENK